jgi:hypothetical protein
MGCGRPAREPMGASGSPRFAVGTPRPKKGIEA